MKYSSKVVSGHFGMVEDVLPLLQSFEGHTALAIQVAVHIPLLVDAPGTEKAIHAGRVRAIIALIFVI
jgi:hypothetical protein